MTARLDGRGWAAIGLAVSLLLGSSGAAAGDWPAALRIGYQKNGLFLVVKHQGALADALAAHGTALKWVEFPSGPPMLEALNAGSLDVGTVGDTPPIFAQAAGTSIVYFASQPQPGASYAILVPKESAVRSIQDLKGKRVGFTKGSAAQNLVIRALRHGGLDYGDITPVFLSPADASAAFQSGRIDAWAIWDPFFAIAELDLGARVLSTAEGVAPTNVFFVAEKGYAARNRPVLEVVIEALRGAATWAIANRDSVARLDAEVTGVSLAADERTASRAAYGISLMDDGVVAQQQAIADAFYGLRIIPRPISVAEIVWRPDKPS